MLSEIKKIFNIIFNVFLNLIYNKKCLICGCSKTDDLLCKNCLKDVKFLSLFPHRIYKSIPIYSAFLYEKNIKKLIHLLKFQHRKTAAVVLSGLLFSYFKKLNLKDNYIIIYPPTFFVKSWFRGYSHMELISKHFFLLTNFEFLNDFIIKTKYTKPQYKVKNRFLNIKNSFKINQKYLNKKIENKTFLLIDDITTSGATLEELINLLLENNIKNIVCLTISKAC